MSYGQALAKSSCIVIKNIHKNETIIGKQMEQVTIFLKALSLKIQVILSCNLSTNITVLENQHPENYHLRGFLLSKLSFKAF